MLEEQTTVGTPADDERVLSKAQVRHRFGDVSDTCIARWTANPDVRFPAPDLYINGRPFWFDRTLRQFTEEQARNPVKRTPRERPRAAAVTGDQAGPTSPVNCARVGAVPNRSVGEVA